MLILHAGFDGLFVASAQEAFYAREEHEPERSVARHLYRGGFVDVVSLTPKWPDANELVDALQRVMRGEQPLASLGTLTHERTYTALSEYFEDPL